MKKIQLSIPEPCHESWDAMTPTQQGRFCNACAKEVVDFSNMSDHEVLNYFNRQRSESVCGRAWPDQLDRVITMEPKKKRIWWLQYAAALVLLLFRSGSAKAQGGLIVPVSSSVTLPKAGKALAAPGIVRGQVQDEKGVPIPFASVQWLNTGVGTQTDSAGQFSLKLDVPGAELQISSLGFTTTSFPVHQAGEQTIVLKQEAVELKEVVVIAAVGMGRMSRTVGGMSRCSVSGVVVKEQKTTVISRLFSSFTPAIKAFPNPVAKGGMLTITAELKKAGLYTVQLADAGGKMLLAEQVNSFDKKLQHQITINSSWSAGMYFVKIMDAQGKLVGTEKVMIQ